MSTSTHPTNPQAFATTQLHLLSLEQSSEVTETQLLLSNAAPSLLARSGLAILNLTIASLRTGLGGRTVLELSLDPAVAHPTPGGKGVADLPEHSIRTGDIVRVSELAKGSAKRKDVEVLKAKGVEGVVTRVGERAVWVAIGKEGGDEAEVPDGRLWL
jgi:DNA polymerase alpha-associated DNA helicase A